METMARKGTPDDERMHKLGLAMQINASHGGGVISVWEVDDLPQDWVDFFVGMTHMPRIVERQRKIDQAFKKFEDEHPQYGKRS